MADNKSNENYSDKDKHHHEHHGHHHEHHHTHHGHEHDDPNRPDSSMLGKQWYQLPFMLGVMKNAEFRTDLRANNLHDTSHLPGNDNLTPHPKKEHEEKYKTARSDDGSYNDLKCPAMGMVGQRFGRNFPLSEVFPDHKNLMVPNPREISRKLLTREQFQPATIVNALAACWIQFQTHDWFFHIASETETITIPLEKDDPFPEKHKPFVVKKTAEDTTRPKDDTSGPPTYINGVTHWWDASQLYGSSTERIAQVRTFVDGKLKIEADGYLPIETPGIDLTGFNTNWWTGLSLLHTLFTKEHNYVCDRLKLSYPDANDDFLFTKARLIIAALLAKIHTVEWTTSILPNPVTSFGLKTNWWGASGADFKHNLGRLGSGGNVSDIVSGIVGGSVDHGKAPFAITEEFTGVYRMHSLIPDEYKFYSADNGAHLCDKTFQEISGNRTRKFMENVQFSDIWYSMGISNPGALRLHNFPKFLQNLTKDTGEFLDLAAVDILRDRERGIPRYNRFRELIGRDKLKSFEELCPTKPDWAKEVKEMYGGDLEAVDLLVGLMAEDLPPGFGFSETAYRVFILMASRRLKSDRFLTSDYRGEIYTDMGITYVENTTMIDVIVRHYPKLKPAMEGLSSAFVPWNKITQTTTTATTTTTTTATTNN